MTVLFNGGDHVPKPMPSIVTVRYAFLFSYFPPFMVEQNLSYKCKFAKSDGVDYIYAHVLSGLIEQPMCFL